MGVVQDIVEKLRQAQQQNQEDLQNIDPANAIQPGDEQELANNNVRNILINKLGLPENWQMSVADEKRWNAGAPMNMAMGTLGTVKSFKANPAAAEELVRVQKVFKPQAEQIVQKMVRPAESVDFKLGSQLPGQPVFDVKPAVPNYGKVIVKP